MEDYKQKQKELKFLSKRIIEIEKPFKGYNREQRRTDAYKAAVRKGIKAK